MRSLHPRGLSLALIFATAVITLPISHAVASDGPAAAPTPVSTSVRSTTPVAAPNSLTERAGVAGSLSVGAARYAPPAQAIYVAPVNGTTGTGSAGAPYRGLAHAIARAASGSTLVLRAGTYHESVTVPFGKKLVIQSYPGESVWLDGSSAMTGWVKSGAVWSKSNWNYAFDHRVSFNADMDESRRYVDPAYPMAGYPDQVFIDGAPVRQVASLAAVKSGTFFVDTAGKRLVLGSDPTGRSVRASTLKKAMTIAGTGTVVRGIGVRRYANHLRLFGAVSVEVPQVTLENMIITQNATVGLFAWAKDHRFRNLTVSDNGLMGIGMNKADGLQLTNSRVTRNNNERFKASPASGGIKMAQSRHVKFLGNMIDANTTAGLWFDMSVQDVVVANNVINNNGATALLLEASDSAWFVGNVIAGNGREAISIFDSSHVNVWNNTIVGGPKYGIRILQDERRSGDPQIPFITSAVSLSNNVFSIGTSGCPVLVDDLQDLRTGQTMGVKIDGTLYHRRDSTSPSNLVCWAAGRDGFRTFKNVKDFRAVTGNDAHSRELLGSSPLMADYSLTSTASATLRGAGVGVPETAAALLGVAPGWTGVGAVFPIK